MFGLEGWKCNTEQFIESSSFMNRLQEEVDPLSIAAEDSRLTWALFCVVLQCIAV